MPPPRGGGSMNGTERHVLSNGARTTATSATRTRSSRAAGRSTRGGWTPRSPRSTGYPGPAVVFAPRGMTPAQLEDGYWRAYRDFYRWSALWRGARTKELLGDRLRHL